ncbi:hypothetical protein [Bartonella rattimassiliensis]|uniref:hypothetical protein n=1 Tax=Bartonella rattimassiliensis TaxID=270250 RepID=UPI000476BC84|nr:hypothetical protein [Bartonella rattimassiliensis]
MEKSNSELQCHNWPYWNEWLWYFQDTVRLFTLPGECAKTIIHGKYATCIALKEKLLEHMDAFSQHFEKCGGYALKH